MHRQFGSKRFLEVLTCLGLCVPYKEAVLYESSSVFHPHLSISPPEEEYFIQYVCNNADHNMATIDGLNTFHSMGIIKIIIPYDKIHEAQLITRLTTMPIAAEMATIAQVQRKIYKNYGVQRFKKIMVEKLDCDEMTTTSTLRNSDILWIYGNAYQKFQDGVDL